MKDKYKQLLNKSYIINILFGILKIILGMSIRFYSFCISAIYNIAVGISKYKVRSKKQDSIGLLIIISSLLYISYSIYIIVHHHNPIYHMYLGIIIAADTFSEIVISIIGIIKAKNKENKLIKYSNLCNGIISLALTQTAILSFTNPNKDLSLYNGLGGIIFSCVTIIIGIYLIINKKGEIT